MLKQIFFGLTFVLFLISCNSHPATQTARDSTIPTIGNLEGDLDQDTIFSRVYYDADSIYVDSKWIKNNHVLWKDKYVDPYTELGADLLDSSRNTWVYFAIGVIYGPPDILPRNVMDSGTLTMVYDQGIPGRLMDLE